MEPMGMVIGHKDKKRDEMTEARRVSRRVCAIVALVLCALWTPAHAELVRYLDDNGHPVISYTLPPERAQYGYEILNPKTMRVVKTVPAQMSREEYEAKQIADEALQQCQRELNRVQSMYETEADVAYARRQAQDSIDERIKNAQLSKKQLENYLREQEAQAARLERGGNTLTGVLMGNIEKSRSQINNLEQEIQSRRQDKIEIDQQYDADLLTLQRRGCEPNADVAATRDKPLR